MSNSNDKFAYRLRNSEGYETRFYDEFRSAKALATKWNNYEKKYGGKAAWTVVTFKLVEVASA